jgi:hypothetical protein
VDETPTFRRKLYIGRGLRCAIYIISSLGFQASEYFLPMSVRPGVCIRRIGQQRLNRISCNLLALQHICCFYYVTVFSRRGHSLLPPVRQEVVSVQ